MINLAKLFTSLWHPILAASQLLIDWLTQYIEHSQANPTFHWAAWHVKKPKPAVGGNGDDSSRDGSEEDSDNILDDNDDIDASPYQ